MRMWASKSFRHEMLPSVINVHPKILPSVNAYTRGSNASIDTHTHTRTRAQLLRTKTFLAQNSPLFRLFPLSRTLFHCPPVSFLSVHAQKKKEIYTQLHLQSEWLFPLRWTTGPRPIVFSDNVASSSFFRERIHEDKEVMRNWCVMSLCVTFNWGLYVIVYI